ncbi:DUF2059 domain-containing protein [Halioxenophilus aromaticivorans]|uniref:DUF2059 domain-containing protein n=1 Tax=Halioxenophilus aromaticivorans TaxID=1306992 RepID=A0AAV3U517_9ALTE
MRKAAAIALGLLLAVNVHAQDSKQESVEALLEASDADAMVDTLYSQMNQMIEGMGRQLGIKPDEQPMFDAYMNNVFTTMKEDMSWAKMKGPMIEIYSKHYSEEEVQDMLAFYQSKSGQSMVAKMPAVMADSMQVSQQLLQAFLPKVQVMAQELQVQLQNHRTKQ